MTISFLACVAEPVARDILLHALQHIEQRDRCTYGIIFCSDWEEIARETENISPHVLIFDPAGPSTDPYLELARYQADFPLVTLLAYGDLAALPPRALERLFDLGVQGYADPYREDAVVVSYHLSRALEATFYGRVYSALKGHFPVALHPLLRVLLARPSDQRTPADVARLYHRHARTLGGLLRKHELPSIARLITWVRLLYAAHLLKHPHRSVERAALQAGFPSANGFRGQLGRYARVSPQALRENDGVQFLLDTFQRSCIGCEGAIGITS